ncbi:COX assembly mitochondrial protein homolog isoform X3 [Rhineura floridana]|uniref:COX assembly mitochondrial protein homolog isoform X3 n=1 Tax=Rhineura floridana TaxID=261503 RepID=UPI002AC84AA7|nr:COX assembly mitochondrial protein homolog isoform X3 [Rhineura floridana]
MERCMDLNLEPSAASPCHDKASGEEPKLRHVEKDVLIPKLMREKARELCSDKVQVKNSARSHFSPPFFILQSEQMWSSVCWERNFTKKVLLYLLYICVNIYIENKLFTLP